MPRMTSSPDFIQASGVASGKWIAPGGLARPVPAVRVGTIAAVTTMLVYGHDAVLDQHTERQPCNVQ